MKAEYINPFITASTSIINQTTGLNIKPGSVYVKNTPYKGDNVLVMIGLTGQITGNVVISFEMAAACNIASAMMMGMPVPELDDISKSAISELCNMIMGNAAIVFSQNGVIVDITPPTLLIGENMMLSVHKSVIICVPLLLEDGSKLEIDISYVEK